MSPDQIGGLIGGLVGGMIGLAGGAVGTYCSIRNAQGPRERQFMVHSSIVVWVAVLLFLALLFTLPSPWRHLLWIPYGILLPTGIIMGNRKILAIRREEANQQPETAKM